MTKHAGQAVRQPEPLFDERHEVMTVPLPADDQGRLLHEERVDVVEVEPGADRHINQSPLSGADRGVAPEVVEEVTPPVEKVPSGDRSLVDAASPLTFTLAFRAFKPVRRRTGPPREPSVVGRVLFSGWLRGERRLSGT